MDELEMDIRALEQNQNDMTIQELYSGMTNLWDQFSPTESAELRSFAPYISRREEQRVVQFFSRREEQRVVQFLMALGVDFEGLRGSILHRNTLPINEPVADELGLKLQSQKRNIKFKGSVDRLSMLSDDLLGLILSSLTLTEAMETSILSRRWKYLWTLTRKLDFDGTEYGTECERRRMSANGSVREFERNKEISKLVKWVDRGLAASTSILEEFRVHFDLNINHTKHIDEWLKSALSRKVERLDLNLTDRWKRRYRFYQFPYNEGNFPNDFKLIKNLSTNCVNVRGEAAQFILANCPLLEQLSLSNSAQLNYLQIVRTSPSFKCLEICGCQNLHYILIRDSNVVCFKYKDCKRVHLELTNVPMLTQVWIGGALSRRMDHVVQMFSGVLPQLQMFKIYLYSDNALCWHETNKAYLKAVRMPNLKELVVNIGGFYDGKDSSLLPLIHIITTLPSLQRFVIEAPHKDRKCKHLFESASHINKIHIHIHKIHIHNPQLKEVEFVGYRGVNTQFEFIMHFVKNAIALQNIVVDPRCFNFENDRPWDLISEPKIEEEKSARAYADQLKDCVPRRINVKIL